MLFLRMLLKWLDTGQFVTTWIDVDGGVEGLDVYCLFYTPI